MAHRFGKQQHLQGDVARLVGAHLATVVGEWIAILGVLMYAYARAGATAVGSASIVCLLPPLLGAPLAANLMARWSPATLRSVGFAAQALLYGLATVLAIQGAPAFVVVGAIALGLCSMSLLRPTGAAMLPTLVRSTKELLSGNLVISYADSSAALAGSLGAAGLAELGGPNLMLGGAAATALIAGVLSSSWATHRDVQRGRVGTTVGRSPQILRQAFADVKINRSSVGVIGLASARNVVIGGFDVILVVLAREVMHLDQGGPGLLSALVGLGALASSVLITRLYHRPHVHSALLTAASVVIAGCFLLSFRLVNVGIYLTLIVVGVGLSTLDNLGRILLQRASDPRRVGSLFAILGMATGLAQMSGAALAWVLLMSFGVREATLGVCVAVLLITLVSVRTVRKVDSTTVLPVVEMALLARHPVVSLLPTPLLELVGRTSQLTTVEIGTNVVTQGQMGTDFYVIADGEFDVLIDGEYVRTLRSGDGFGEVALLASIPRTATVSARTEGQLLSIGRTQFLDAVIGHDIAARAALDQVANLRIDDETRLALGWETAAASSAATSLEAH